MELTPDEKQLIVRALNCLGVSTGAKAESNHRTLTDEEHIQMNKIVNLIVKINEDLRSS